MAQTLSRQRKQHFEFATLPEPLAPGPNAPAMHLDELLHQRKPDPEPAMDARQGSIRLREEIEHAGHQLRRNTGAIIADADYGLLASASRRALDAAARLGKLGRIVKQVSDNLLETSRVGVDLRRLGLGREREHQRL